MIFHKYRLSDIAKSLENLAISTPLAILLSAAFVATRPRR